MWPPVSLPYFRQRSSLPAPLPTKEKIETSTRDMRPADGYRRAVVVGQHFLVKYGPTVDQREGDTLLFIEQNLNIPAPRLYAMYRDESNGWVYIIMELLPGESLEKIWPTLGESDKALITGKLRSIFTQMRDLPSPSFYGDVCRRDLPNNLFWTEEKLPSISGPFQNEHNLNMGLVEKLRMNAAGFKSRFNKADFYARNLSRSLHNHPPTFSHSDVQKKNILVQEIPAKSPGQVKDFEVGVVDWEAAGWYPSYWEYVSLAMFFEWNEDWPARFEDFIDAWPAELALFQVLHAEIMY
jgi:aminoglycoside phosphotransferase (APT) family kinase protein